MRKYGFESKVVLSFMSEPDLLLVIGADHWVESEGMIDWASGGTRLHQLTSRRVIIRRMTSIKCAQGRAAANLVMAKGVDLAVIYAVYRTNCVIKSCRTLGRAGPAGRIIWCGGFSNVEPP